MEKQKLWASLFVLLIISAVVNARPKTFELEEREADPGWVRRQLIRAKEVASRFRSGLANTNIRRQLIRAGEAASRVGSGLGGYAVGLTNAVDRICKIIKKIIPIVGAVCTVGKFQFCALDNMTSDMPGPSPIAGPGIVDLTVQD